MPAKSKPNHGMFRRIAAGLRRTVRLASRRLLLRYRYPLSPLLLRRPRVDMEVTDINSDIVRNSLAEFDPDLICIYGTKKIRSEILELAPNALNIHDGFVPYYRGVSSGAWVSFESNYSYLYYCIHEAISRLDAGIVYRLDPVVPYFFESSTDHNYRRSTTAADAMVEVTRGLLNGTIQGYPQPSVGARNLRHRDKPQLFGEIASANFVSNNARTYKRSRPRTGRIEKLLVDRQKNPNRGVLSNGWYVVNYHAIVDDNDFDHTGVPRIVTERKRFAEHIDVYRREFTLVSVSEGISLLKRGSAEKRRYLSLTFDDTLQSPFSAMDLLGSSGIVPTFFINSDPVLNERQLKNHHTLLKRLYEAARPVASYDEWVLSQYMNLDDLRQACDDGSAEIGSHTATHARVNHTRFEELQVEIQENHRSLESALGREIDYFAFPYGGLNDRSFLAEFEAITTARYYFTAEGGINQHYVPGALLRIGIHNEDVGGLLQLLSDQYVR